MTGWPRIRLLYRSGDDIVTEREATAIRVCPPFEIVARCHLRNEDRTFRVDRITKAVVVDTGEIIADVGRYFGLASTALPEVPDIPVFDVRPRAMPQGESKARRNADMRELFRHCAHPLVEAFVREELLALFNQACFACGRPGALKGGGLVMDHHVPAYLGGRLVPGNIALLCHRCNGLKADRHPDEFYSAQRIAEIRPILKAEVKLFGFEWKWWRYKRDGDAYLREIGIPQARIDALRPIAEEWERSLSDSPGISFELSVTIKKPEGSPGNCPSG